MTETASTGVEIESAPAPVVAQQLPMLPEIDFSVATTRRAFSGDQKTLRERTVLQLKKLQ